MIVGGLNWWQSWIWYVYMNHVRFGKMSESNDEYSVWLGYAIAACFICITGRIGATYHIGFPVIARSSFGIWGSLWPVFNRAAMACVWYGVQAWIGGECVRLMVASIWRSFDRLPNTIPNSGTDTENFVAFFIFWSCSLPAIWFSVQTIRHLFTLKAYVVPVAAISYLVWALVKAHDIGPIIHKKAEISGSDFSWAMVKGIMSSIANFATLIVNDPDFTRFARKPRDTLWSQLITIPTGFAITSLIGILVSSSSQVIYGEPIWNPLDLLQNFLNEGDSATRAGVFLIAFAFALAQLGTNIAANSVSAGTDMTALLPRFLNIRRGGYICAIVGLAMCPWRLLSSSNNFTTYLSAYSVFLSSIAGVLVSDYYFVRKGFLQIRDLYSARKRGPYYYTMGFNWRAYTAYLAGIAINMAGFINALEVGVHFSMAAQYIYNVNFFCGFIVSSAVYYALNRIFPVPATADTWTEVGDEITEVILADDSSSYDEEKHHQKGTQSGVVVDEKRGSR